MKLLRHRNVWYLIVLIAFNVHGQAVDKCVDEIDRLKATSFDNGITQPASGSTDGLVKDCETALQQNPQSTSLRLNLARSLIWTGRESSGLIQLEMLIGTDKEQDVMELATALCAHGRGGNVVISKTCEWSVDYGMSNPVLAEKAANNMLHGGKPELGLRFIAQAAVEGSSTARQYVSNLCSEYTPIASVAFASLPATLTSLDPAFIAATACEASFNSTPQDQESWANYGFKYAEAMTFFDDYESTARTLLSLSESSDAAVVGGAIDVLDSLCTATAGDPNDPDFGSEGVSDAELFPDRAQAVCEAAAYVWPDNGRLHYNLSRIYSFLGLSEQASADDALNEALRLGYSLAKNMAYSSPVTFDINQFNAPDFIRAFYTQDMASLNQEPYYAMVYAMGLHGVFSQDNVLFLGDNAREILLEVDSTLTYKASQKLINNPALFDDILNKGIENLLAPIDSVVKSRQRDVSIEQEVRSVYNAILNTPLVQADVLKQKALQDGRRLAILYESNPDDFRKVYAGLKRFIEQ